MKEADNNLFAFISGSKASQRPGWLERGSLSILFAFNTHECDTDSDDTHVIGNNNASGH